jgi:hypothetical protein
LIAADSRDVWQDLYAYVAAELRVASAVNLPHAAAADERDDFVSSKAYSVAEQLCNRICGIGRRGAGRPDVEDRGGSKITRPLMRIDEQGDFALHRGVIGACRREERGAFGRLAVECRLEEICQSRPAFRRHVRV